MEKSDSAICVYLPQHTRDMNSLNSNNHHRHHHHHNLQSNITENQTTISECQLQQNQINKEQITFIPSPFTTRKNTSPQTIKTQQQQKYILFEMLQNTFGSNGSLSTNNNNANNKKSTSIINERITTTKKYNQKIENDNLSTILSVLYAKFVVVLGIAFPITDILSIKAPPSFYQGFYLYLYTISVIFVVFIYVIHLKRKFTYSSLLQHYYSDHTPIEDTDKNPQNSKSIIPEKTTIRYGSFYLRIVAVAFGIGSMVYSGLEFGQYFELKNDKRCHNILIILNPAARMLLTIVQMQFIFLNTNDLKLKNYKNICRFGLMHMIATNLCEWLYVLVEETKHEIYHIAHKNINEIINEYDYQQNNDNDNQTYQNYQHHIIVKRATSLEIVVECRRTNIMGNLVQDASPFLFPCTIEYSLICAVTLFEMWKNILNAHGGAGGVNRNETKFRKLSTSDKDAHHFSVDCARAHKGLFGGILVIVLSIISLVLYFELSTVTTATDLAMQEIGILGIILSECLLFTVATIAVLFAMYQMRNLRYSKSYYGSSQSLDCNLLIVAQSGIYIYTMFSIIGTYFSLDIDKYGVFSLVTEIISLIQTSIQTVFILNAWWKRCHNNNSHEIRRKPGREIITFLVVTNMSLWSINSLIKNRAAFRPTHLQFFGQWAWTIITHISMPLAIFYRLHSTICLFEIWKTTYKVRKVSE